MSRIALALSVFALLCTPAARAAPMSCTTEQKSCLAVCQKNPAALLGNCIATCRQRFNYCRNTGCWDSGTSRYCGLLRQ